MKIRRVVEKPWNKEIDGRNQIEISFSSIVGGNVRREILQAGQSVN